MRFLLAICFLSGALASPLLGKNHCTWGPSYWCQHLDAAKECNAVSHCLNVWRLNKIDESKLHGKKCGFCQELVTDLKNFVASGKTQHEISELASIGCKLLKNNELRAVCTLAVTKYMPEIFQMLTLKLQPSQICSAIGLCSDYKPTSKFQSISQSRKTNVKLHEKPLIRVPLKISHHNQNRQLPLSLKSSNTSCQDCLKIIGELQSIIKANSTEQEVEDFLKQNLCANAGPMQGQCNQLVTQYVPVIIQLIIQELDPNTVCQMIGLCTQRSTPQQIVATRDAFLKLIYARQLLNPLPPVPKGVAVTPECQVCELIVSEARTLIAKNSTQAEIEEFLRVRLCAHLGAWKDKCDAYVTEFGPMIFQLITSELSPTVVCQALGACGKSFKMAHRTPILSSKNKKLRSSSQCIMCELVVREVVANLGTNKSEQVIEAALMKVCALLPTTIRAECNSFVQEYAPAVIKLLASDIKPEVVCTALGLCSSARDQRSNPSVLRFHRGPIIKRVAGEEACEACQTVVTMAVALLKEQKTVDEVENVLEKVCNFLPKSDRPACDAIVKQYTPELIQLLMTELSPRKVCQALKLCTAKTTRRYDGRVHILRAGK